MHNSLQLLSSLKAVVTDMYNYEGGGAALDKLYDEAQFYISGLENNLSKDAKKNND